MRTMRVVEAERFGGPDVMEVVTRPVPEPDRTEVLIRVAAAGVNPVDWYQYEARSGTPAAGPAVPLRFGWELAGTVERVGPGVTIWSPGDRVMGVVRYPHPAGAYADYVVAPARQLAAVPGGLELHPAATLPFGGLTAWQALHDCAAVRPGERVLINAANGGVGQLAVQIAQALGGSVTAVARRDVHEHVPVDVRGDVVDIDDPLRPSFHDVAVDLVGGEMQRRWVESLRPGGRLVLLADEASAEVRALAAGRGIRIDEPIVEPDGHALGRLAAFVADGSVVPRIGATFDLASVVDAHRAAQQRTVRSGKIVLAVA